MFYKLLDNGSFNNFSVIDPGSVGEEAEDENQEEEDVAPDFPSEFQLSCQSLCVNLDNRVGAKYIGTCT